MPLRSVNSLSLSLSLEKGRQKGRKERVKLRKGVQLERRKEGRKESEFVPHAEKIGFLHMIKVRSLRKFEFGIASLSGRKGASRHGLHQIEPQ